MKGIKQLQRILATLILLLPCLAFAQEPVQSSEESTLQRIEKKIDNIATQSEQSSQIKIEQPLGNRTQGFEFNFFRLLTLGEDDKSLSGTYSFFNTENNTEIALPFMYSSSLHQSLWDYELLDINEKLTSYTLDAHYRKYLGHRLDGFYLSAFTRAAYLSGIKGDESNYSYSSLNTANYKKGSEFKLGIGFGIGYRIISQSGYYWGSSLSVGKYLIGDSDVFVDSEGISSTLDDEEFIVDIELLKFGFAF